MSRIMIGSRVKHDYGNDRGTVTACRRDKQGYNYQVEWDYPDKPDNKIDWYKREVLVLL